MSDTDFIKVANRDELYVVNLLDVAYFKAEGHFTNVFYLGGTKLLLPCGISKIYEKIKAIHGTNDTYLKVGRNLVINKCKVCCVNPVKELIFFIGQNGMLLNVHAPKSVLRDIMKELF